MGRVLDHSHGSDHKVAGQFTHKGSLGNNVSSEPAKCFKIVQFFMVEDAYNA